MEWGSLGHSHTKSWLRVCSARISISISWLKLKVEVSRQQAVKAARMVRWGGSRLGDCHRVAPLLPQPLIWPACTGFRAKAEDYLLCTSTSTTHCFSAKLHHAVLQPPASCFAVQLQMVCSHASAIFSSVVNILPQFLLLQVHFEHIIIVIPLILSMVLNTWCVVSHCANAPETGN